MKLIFLIALLLNYSTQACSEGCLKCSKEDECQICDSINFYKLTDKKCNQHKPDNCLLIDLSGNCLSCEKNYYIEPQLKKCIEIGLANRTENCRLYDSKLNCTFCEENFFIAGSVCKAQENTIENCLYYQDQETCLECKPGSIVSIDRLSCESTLSNSNCIKFSKVKCNECQPGYLYNELAYESQWFKSTSLFEKDKLMTLVYAQGFKTIEKQYVCQKQLVDNCEYFQDLNTCTKCSFGYYLSTSGQCIVNPFPSIQNCEVYFNRNSCSKCMQTYYRQSEISCIKVQDISNCATYSQTANTTICEQCQTQFYLNGTDKCIERENRVENCFEYEINLDVCKSCSESFILTDDKLNCLNKIDNCQVYKPSTFETQELECYKCINGYHLNGKLCEKGTIDNCEVYNIDSTHTNQICEQCKNQFVLNGQTCIQSQKITDCDVYHPLTQNACKQCLAETQNILLGKVCVDQPVIANCEQYNQTGTTELQCSQCGDGYYLTDDFQCSEIQIEKCITLENDKVTCSACEEGFFLWDNRCISRPLVHSTNCVDTSYDDSLIFEYGCQACKENLFPLDLGTSGICFEEDFLPNGNSIENCIQYDSDDNFRCKLCKEGLVRSYSNGKYVCTEDCDHPIKSIKRTLSDINQCFLFGDDNNCLIVAYSYNQDYICTKCKTGYIQKLVKVFDSTLLYSMTNTSLFFNLFDDLQDKNFAVSCVQESSVTPSQLTANCQYYYENGGTYKCIKCQDFYTGTFSANSQISSCERDTQFTETKIYNINETYGIVQSGYQCQDDLEIPWINIRNEAVKGLCSVDISNLQVDFENNLENRSNFCANPNIIDSSYNIPQNCGTILTKSVLSVDKCQLKTIECLYCKPKFKPTITDSKIATCTFIDNCIGDNWFNACSKCENGYAYKYVSDDVVYDECVQYADTNCFAYNVSDEECEICKYGYTLIKGACELIVPQKCKLQSSFNFLSQNTYYSSSDIGYTNALKFNLKYFYNCQDCQQGYISIVALSYNFCIESDKLTQLYNDTGFDQNDYYIQNCVSYQNLMQQGSIKHYCQKCGNDLYAFNQECITPLTHCEVVIEEFPGSRVCQKCKQGYGLQGGNCVVSEVSNCIENQTFDTCKTCEQGYFEDNGKCTKSLVENCETVTALLKCSKCFEGYLMYETVAQDYCFPQPKDIKCKQGKIYQDVEFGAEVICESCPKVNQLLLSDVEANFDFKSICAPIDKKDHCIKYNENRLFNIANFNCMECESDYYLKDGKVCTLRELKVDKCLKYLIAHDFCQQCEEGYYLEEAKCVANPFGIQGCIVYETSDSCLQCETNKFSQDGLCYPVEENNKIENCEIYQTGTLCEACVSGYFLQDNQCIKSQLQNCLEFESASVCKKCADQYELKTEETKTSCQKVEKERCVKVDLSKENQPCLECEFLYFVNQTTGNCDEVPKENRIDNCLAYINDRECLKCDVGYVLTKDKLLCSKNPLLVNQIPDNCKDAQENELFCSICKGGYQIEDGNCKQCTENNWQSGCQYCLTDYEGCYICRSGYMMNKDQQCVKDNQSNQNTNNEVTEVESTNILYLVMITLILLI